MNDRFLNAYISFWEPNIKQHILVCMSNLLPESIDKATGVIIAECITPCKPIHQFPTMHYAKALPFYP